MSHPLMAHPSADQTTGSVLGLALGDALGAVVEALPPGDARDYVEQVLRLGQLPAKGREHYPFGQVTDDTQLTRELLQSIVDAGRFEPALFATRLLNFVASGRLVGGGPAPHEAAKQLALGTPWHEAGMPAPYAGNGAAMRAGPLGVLFGRDPRVLTRVVADQARVTHQDPRCAAGAMAIAGAAAIAARRTPIRPAEFLVELSGWVEPIEAGFAAALWEMTTWVHRPPDEASEVLFDLSLDPERESRRQGISSFVTSSVCWSLFAFLQAPDSYWDAICIAIAVGGDTDTMAAMTGSIAGARLGAGALPPEFCDRLTDAGAWGAEHLATLARWCHDRVFGR
ncbi:MAG TPA: ADP-ribosylglycohydrolase family protein, partial [Gemmatimonadales bacterium]|nr:ADP-ribosylglycohydrolase family protein [Gemmatimonadales bacterium]